jgi:DNA modification methylase
VPDYESVGRVFESRRARHLLKPLQIRINCKGFFFFIGNCRFLLAFIDIASASWQKHAMNPKATSHTIFFDDAHDMEAVKDRSIQLVVTSPPYPMVEMWDAQFSASDDTVAKALSRSDFNLAFERMHQNLDGVWKEVHRILQPGGIACINIGDATRTFDEHFRLFANHARIIQWFHDNGFSQLPTILWRKTTNAPNKFMGSGMLPPGAYVTLEHEYLLIFRKGAKREFPDAAQKEIRRHSAYFWEERNLWFSDVWMGLPGTVQKLRNSQTRQRSGAFPLELPYRLINMFSIQGDTVLDPFAGSGTTLLAAMCAGRNSLGYEIDATLHQVLLGRISSLPDTAQQLVQDRLAAHRAFVMDRQASGGELKYQNRHHLFPVITQQEVDLRLDSVSSVQYLSDRLFQIDYDDQAKSNPIKQVADPSDADASLDPKLRAYRGQQLKLF